MKHLFTLLAVIIITGGCGGTDSSIPTDIEGAYCNPTCAAAGPCVGTAHWGVCNNMCWDLLSSQANCGACGLVCDASKICSNGVCVPNTLVCAAGQTPCGTQCVNTTSDPINCGGCNVACPAGQTCNLGQCSCPNGGLFCGAACVDRLTDSLNCGGCNVVCSAGKTCVSGNCACAANQLLCSNGCIDPKTDANNCGTCTLACKGGRTCQAGTCVCPTGDQLCGDSCADLTSDVNNCGSCGKKCTGGESCITGVCQCAAGQTKCDGQCIDTSKDPKNCGACKTACFSSETCTSGACRAEIGADGCDGAAQGITLSEVAAYQAVKIPLASGQKEVASGSRVAAIVQNKNLLFRAFVKPDSGFTARELSARVTLKNGANQDQYYAKLKPSKSSTDADANSTFQINVPASKIQAATEYSVELVECGGTGSGTAGASRFPATGMAKLSATKTGTVKLTYIPVKYNNLLPDTSEKVLAIYQKYLDAMYPSVAFETSIGKEMSAQAGFLGLQWSTVLDQLRSKRASESPPDDVYYFALIKPAATFEEYCRTSCTLGISYVAGVNDGDVRVAMGAAFADEMTGTTIAHELGHSHGQNHAPCAPGGQISGVDGNYPYTGAQCGVWGYDAHTEKFMDPVKNLDIMSYCHPQWISDYTYKALTKRIIEVNTSPFKLVNTADMALWRVAILDSQGARWGIPFSKPKTPYGEPEDVIVLDQSGNIIKTVTGYRTIISSDENAAMVLVPEPEAGWYAIKPAGWPALVY
jgi:hypothetical protein